MFFGIDLNQIITFPFKDAEARKHFLVGCAVSLAAFIIPLFPFFVLYGYAARIVKQILNNESPHMIAWDDWGGMFKDGAKLFGVRIVYALPIILFASPLFISMVVAPFFMGNASDSQLNVFFPILILIILGTICVLLPVALVFGVIIPGAEIYSIDKNEFSAGFQIRNWWPIFRANLSGFIVAFAVYYFGTMILGLVIQIIGATLILSCLLIILMPATTLYIVLLMFTTSAQAYMVGKEKLAQTELATK